MEGNSLGLTNKPHPSWRDLFGSLLPNLGQTPTLVLLFLLWPWRLQTMSPVLFLSTLLFLGAKSSGSKTILWNINISWTLYIMAGLCQPPRLMPLKSSGPNSKTREG